MLIGQHDFVEIAGDRDLIVGEISEPRAITRHSVRQKMQNVAQRHRHGIAGDFCFTDGTGLFFRTEINSQAALSHGRRFLTSGMIEPNRITSCDAGRAEWSARRFARPYLLCAMYRL